MQLLSTVCKRFLAAVCIIGCLGLPLFANNAAQKPDVPKPVGYVNDFAKILDNTSIAKLTQLTAQLESASGIEMVYVIMPDIEPYDDMTYGMAIFDQWKIGKKGKDNGLLILLAIKERRIRILTGYGLEHILPDGKLGRYRDQYLVPFLKQGKTGEGLYNIGLAITQEISRKTGVQLTGAAAKRPYSRRKESPLAWLIILFVTIIVGFLSSRSSRRRGIRSTTGMYYGGGTYYRGGGGFGGGFGGFGGGFSGGGGVGGSW